MGKWEDTVQIIRYRRYLQLLCMRSCCVLLDIFLMLLHYKYNGLAKIKSLSMTGCVCHAVGFDTWRFDRHVAGLKVKICRQVWIYIFAVAFCSIFLANDRFFIYLCQIIIFFCLCFCIPIDKLCHMRKVMH